MPIASFLRVACYKGKGKTSGVCRAFTSAWSHSIQAHPVYVSASEDGFVNPWASATVVTVADANAGDKIKPVGLAVQAKEPAKRALVAEDLSIEPYTIVQDTVQSGNTAAAIGGAVVGGLLGSQIGAGGGAVVGNQAAQRQTLVRRIGVRYDDGSLATIQQATHRPCASATVFASRGTASSSSGRVPTEDSSPAAIGLT